jgi:hypothetical protein
MTLVDNSVTALVQEVEKQILKSNRPSSLGNKRRGENVKLEIADTTQVDKARLFKRLSEMKTNNECMCWL